MRIDLPAVLKAGLAGALLGVILGLLTAIPRFLPGGDLLLVLLMICGGAAIPLLAGLLYGYFAPGRETPAQGALGGALAGFASGALYALFQSVIAVLSLVMAGDRLRGFLSAGRISPLAACCLALLVGPILGAVGGALWIARQGRQAPLNDI